MYQVSSSTEACFPRWEPALGHSGTSAQSDAIWHVSFHVFTLYKLLIHSACHCCIIEQYIEFLNLIFKTHTLSIDGSQHVFAAVGITHWSTITELTYFWLWLFLIPTDHLYLGSWWCDTGEVPSWPAGGKMRHSYFGSTRPSPCGTSI